ncbi:MAG: GHMP family kinase ATP-binding protein [Planctomycetota bacterium]|jgi:L-arabinokinase
MQVEEKVNGQRRVKKVADSKTMEPTVKDWTSSKLVADVLSRLRDDSPRFVACAPGQLDVMGGIAEYTGSLVLTMPSGEEVCAGVQRREDDTISIETASDDASQGRSPTVTSISQLYGDDGVAVDPKQGLERFSDWDDAAGYIVGVLTEALREGVVSDFTGGLTIVVGGSTPQVGGVMQRAAMAGAVLGATARAFDVEVDPQKAFEICRRVENDWLGWPVGVADAVCALLGEPDTLLQLQSESHNIAGTIHLPDNLALVGVDCGNCQADARLKYERVRVAAFMGRSLVDRIVRYDGGNHSWWDGCLSRISVNDYVERFRDRIPTKMKGKEFLERFGETGDPLTRIEPGFMYKIRSRTEHHIYEHARACQFAECLSRGIRTGDAGVFAEAGELMYASHWSYGQRCGLGDVRTDLLVTLIRRRGVDADLYGAKISGRGCGGGVAILMCDTDCAWAAVEETLQTFQSKSGQEPRLLRGSSPGVLVAGVQQM